MRKVRHKFGSIATVKDDMRFDSKLEAKYYEKLKLFKQHGDLLFFLRQVPFHLPGGVVYRADFIEFWKDGEVQVTDIKGFETSDFIMKKKLVEALYPITINVIKKV